MEKNQVTILEYSDSVVSVCSFWRSRGVLSELSRQGYIDIIESDWNSDWTTIRMCDIAFFQRPMSSKCLQQVMICKDLGLKIWVDLDDYNSIPVYHEAYDLYIKEYDELSFQKIMMLADVVTTTTKYLQNHYLSYNNNVIIIPNAINDYWIPFNKQSINKLVFYRGGGHKATDLWEYKDCIIEVMNRHKDWEFCCIGYDPEFIKSKISNYQYLGDFSIHDYIALILQSKPSIFVIPLADNKINKGKSNINWIESTISGAVTLTPHYWHLNNYSLTYKDKKSFTINFERLIVEDDLRKELWTKSVQKVKKDYLLSNVNKQRLEIIKNLIK